MVGVQTPSTAWVPPSVANRGDEVIDFYAEHGGKLDLWQEEVIRGGTGLDKRGRWSAFEVGCIVSRQNGKGEIIQAIELAGIFLFGEKLIIHSAHQFDTSMEAFLRMENFIEDADLQSALKPRGGVSRSHGSEGFFFKDGSRIRYRTRTKGGGRGFSGDKLIFDEAMVLPEFTLSALLPTLSARPMSQVWYFGSAVDQMVHTDGVVLARIRERGHKGGDKSLAFFEWSAGEKDETPETVERDTLADPERWAMANPALGIRISAEHIENELRSMDDRGFAVERLGIGSWPLTDKSLATIIDMATWAKLRDDASVVMPGAFAFDVSPARTQASIAVAGVREDDNLHVEVIEPGQEIAFTSRGTGWVVPRIAGIASRNPGVVFLCASSSPAASLVPELEAAGVRVETVGPTEEGKACGNFFDVVDQERLRYPENTYLTKALKGAKARPLGDSWAWARKTSSVDITPLVASTLALWGARRAKPSVYETRGVAVIAA